MASNLFFALLCMASAVVAQAAAQETDVTAKVAESPAGAEGRRQGALDEQGEALDVETILTETSPASAYGDLTNCIRSASYRKIEVLDDRHLLFIGRRAVWLNRLRQRCRLHGDVIFVIEPSSSRLCDLDRVTGHDRFGISSWRGTCILGEFQKIDPQQAAALKEAVALAKDRKR